MASNYEKLMTIPEVAEYCRLNHLEEKAFPGDWPNPQFELITKEEALVLERKQRKEREDGRKFVESLLAKVS